MNKTAEKKGTILIVEDEPAFLKILVSKFVSHGYRVMTAVNGKEAFEQTKVEQPDVIITDLVMPVMDGFEFIHKLRESDGWGKGVFIIILSNRGDMDAIADSTELGAHHYFVKAEIGPNRVLEAVNEYIDKRNAS